MSGVVHRPLHLTERGDFLSFGGEVAEFAVRMGWDPMPFQREWWDVSLEYVLTPGVGLGHEFVRDQACMTIPRQNGKSVSLLAVVGWACEKWPGLKVGWVAQERSIAKELLKDLAHRLLESGDSVKWLETTGNERINWLDNGSSVRVLSSTEKAGHGASWDLVVGDETWRLKYATLQSIVPAQIARPSSLMYLISTQGDEESSVLNDLCERGRVGDESLTYCEWACPDGMDPFDEDNWPVFMPGLAQSAFITLKKIRSGAKMFASSPNEFVRAYANRLTRSDASAFPEEWIDRAIGVVPDAVDGLVVSVDVGRVVAGVSVGVGMVVDGQVVGDLAEYRVGGSTRWVGKRVGELVSKYRAEAVVLSFGPAVVVKPDLEALCEEWGVELWDLSVTQTAAAAMRFVELLGEGELLLGSHVPLREALLAARLKKVGDSSRFDRDVLVDQSPLIAVAIAVEVAVQKSLVGAWFGLY